MQGDCTWALLCKGHWRGGGGGKSVACVSDLLVWAAAGWLVRCGCLGCLLEASASFRRGISGFITCICYSTVELVSPGRWTRLDKESF